MRGLSTHIPAVLQMHRPPRMAAIWALSASLAACVSPTWQPPLPGHVLAENLPPRDDKARIPPIVPPNPLPARPKPAPRVETYSVVVQNVAAKEILFALARDAKLNMDIHPGIDGAVTLNAIDQTLPQLLTRIARQVDMRWELDGPNLAVMPDTPFLKNYKVDYVNMVRDASGTLSVTTEVASSVPGAGGPLAPTSANNSVTRIENTAKNHFWDNLVQNIKDILRETDKILPEGSSEEVEEVTGNVATSGTGAQPAATTSRRSSKGNSPPATAAATLAGSPNPAELQNRGTRTVRRTTFREAAAVIAHPETGVITVRATSRQHARIQEFLDQVMSSARRQVLIEATVVEVRLDNGYQQGIDWSRMAGGTGFTLQQHAAAAPPPLSPNGTSPAQIAYVNANSAIGNISATVKLLETFGTVKVISSPKISVLNNQTAVLKVVDNEVYFTIKADTTVSANVAAQTTYTTTVNSVPVGFVMNVTPQISDTAAVVLNVRPSISRKIGVVLDPSPSLAAASIQSPIPVIRTREMESVLRIEDGNVAVMGGLMEDFLSNQDDTIPLVNRIPVVGKLLANRTDQMSRTELVIFLRPTIIRDASLNGDYKSLRERLPGQDFFRNGERALAPAIGDKP